MYGRTEPTGGHCRPEPHRDLCPGCRRGSGFELHYCIFGHDHEGANCQVTGNSGLAETPGNDLVVTLGQFTNQVGTPFDRAATLAHEFGHNLGLTHCGANDPGEHRFDERTQDTVGMPRVRTRPMNGAARGVRVLGREWGGADNEANLVFM